VILAGDVGAVPSAIWRCSPKTTGSWRLFYRQRFPSKEFGKFDLLVKEFAAGEPYLRHERVRAAGFGVAGPLINNRIHATNSALGCRCGTSIAGAERKTHRADDTTWVRRGTAWGIFLPKIFAC